MKPLFRAISARFLCVDLAYAAQPPDIRVPNILDCDDVPDWRVFRMAANEAVSREFAKSTELESMARDLEQNWRHLVCDLPDGCATTGDLSFGFVRDLHVQCHDSNNFDRPRLLCGKCT